MPKCDLISQKGDKKSEIELNKTIFDNTAKEDLIYQAVVAQMANARYTIASSKIRSEVRGGGKKPWKQKGTGNARAGSSRSPIWIGGGVTFGPRNNRNFSNKIPSKMRRKAIYLALSKKLKEKKLILIDKLEFSNIKTKNALEFLNNLPIKEGTILLVIDKSNKNVELSCQNINFMKVSLSSNLNIYDILLYDYIIFTKSSIEELEKIYLNKSSIKKDINKKTDKSNEKLEKSKKAIK